MKATSIFIAAGFICGSLAACGGERASSPEAAPPAAKPAGPPAPTASEGAWEPDGGSADESKKTAAEETPSDKPRKLFQPTITGATAVNAEVGAAGAVLVLGGTATLRVPKDALPEGASVHFALAEESFKGGPGRAGSVYELAPRLKSAGPPFVLELPVDPKVATPNVAFSKIVKNKGNEWMDWDVLPPARIDPEKKVVVIELAELPEAWVHLTSKGPNKK